MKTVLLLLLILPLGGALINALLGRRLPRRAVEAVACAAVLGANVYAGANTLSYDVGDECVHRSNADMIL
ncbi:MAG: hypothetical protein ACLPYB_01285 [Desulfobaccales bacterium]